MSSFLNLGKMNKLNSLAAGKEETGRMGLLWTKVAQFQIAIDLAKLQQSDRARKQMQPCINFTFTQFSCVKYLLKFKIRILQKTKRLLVVDVFRRTGKGKHSRTGLIEIIDSSLAGNR